MNPSVYLYKPSERGFELYLGEVSTLEGLSLLDNAIEIKILEFGATCYKQFGWATEDELPILQTVESVSSFLNAEGEIGLVEFQISLNDIGTFSTHDDGECHFIMQSKKLCISILQKVLPTRYRDILMNTLFSNPGFYISSNPMGVIKKYPTFTEYLANHP